MAFLESRELAFWRGGKAVDWFRNRNRGVTAGRSWRHLSRLLFSELQLGSASLQSRTVCGPGQMVHCCTLHTSVSSRVAKMLLTAGAYTHGELREERLIRVPREGLAVQSIDDQCKSSTRLHTNKDAT